MLLLNKRSGLWLQGIWRHRRQFVCGGGGFICLDRRTAFLHLPRQTNRRTNQRDKQGRLSRTYLEGALHGGGLEGDEQLHVDGPGVLDRVLFQCFGIIWGGKGLVSSVVAECMGGRWSRLHLTLYPVIPSHAHMQTHLRRHHGLVKTRIPLQLGRGHAGIRAEARGGGGALGVDVEGHLWGFGVKLVGSVS